VCLCVCVYLCCAKLIMERETKRGIFFLFCPSIFWSLSALFHFIKNTRKRQRESYIFFFFFRSQKKLLLRNVIAVFLFFLPRFGARAECEQQTKVFAFLAERHSFLLRVHRRVLVRRVVLLVFFCSFASKTLGSEIYK
jgi:hypothetical protein